MPLQAYDRTSPSSSAASHERRILPTLVQSDDFALRQTAARWRSEAMSKTKETAAEALGRRSPGDRLNDEQLLGRAAELVGRGWSQKALAEDRHGRRVEPWSRGAGRWSPLGALIRVWCESGGEGLDVLETAYTSLSLATGGRLEEWNAAPWRTQWHVLSAFARAREFLPEARRQVHTRANAAPAP